MQSGFNILSALYQLVDVPVVTDQIPDILIGDPLKTEQKESIGLNILDNPIRYLQSGICNLNIFLPKLSSGRHNLGRFKELLDIIMPLVEDTEIVTQEGTFHFQIDDDKGIFDDNNRDDMSYYNLRLTFQTLK